MKSPKKKENSDEEPLHKKGDTTERFSDVLLTYVTFKRCF